MNLCQQIGQWIHDHIEKPIQQFLQRLWQSCADAKQWIETQIVTPLENWEQHLEQQCREQECNWWCLCCNKWLCWLVAVIVKVITYVIKTVGEWLVQIVCQILVAILVIIITIMEEVLKWAVLAVVCLLASVCTLIYLLAGLALLAIFLSLVALAAPPVAPIALAVLPIAIPAAVVLLLVARFLCEPNRCRLYGVFVWALKWAILLGTILALIFLSALSALVVVILGGCVAALISVLLKIPCPVPRLWSVP